MLESFVTVALDSLEKWTKVKAPAFFRERVFGLVSAAPAAHLTPDVVVVDSLNILPPAEQAKYFQSFLAAIPAQTRNEMLSRVNRLSEAVKFAREQANGIEVKDRKIAKEVFDFVFGG